MLITFYQTNDPENVINKTLSNPESIQVNLKSVVDLVNPELLLTRSSLNYDSFNYCLFNDINRYYFIDRISSFNGKIVRLNLVPDWLETYKSEILSNVKGSFRKVLEVGDYGQLQINGSGKTIIKEFSSNVELEETEFKLLTVLRWS